MVAGLPGTGIGGLFYLLASGWMLVREGWGKLVKRRDLSRSKVARRQIPLTLAIIAGMWATGEVMGRLLLLLPQNASRRNRILDLLALSTGKYNLWSRSIIFLTLATLVSLYLFMHGARLAMALNRYSRGARLIAGTPDAVGVRAGAILEPLRTLEPLLPAPSGNESEG
jgi:hypothetical protein